MLVVPLVVFAALIAITFAVAAIKGPIADPDLPVVPPGPPDPSEVDPNDTDIGTG